MGVDEKVIAVTGAMGFIGSAISVRLQAEGLSVRKLVRHSKKTDDVGVGEINKATCWDEALSGVNSVIHTAARVHIMNDSAENPLIVFRGVNVEGSVNLAWQAARMGVRRLIFISSVKVNGEVTFPGSPFCEHDEPAPADPYAISKLEAEQKLRQLEKETGLEVVIIRPPLVYGPGVKANFLRLMGAVQKGLPLPLGLVRNKRSLVAIENLVDLILTCIDHPAAAGKTFLVSDGQDLSTPELIRKLAYFIGRSARLLPVPATLLRLGGYMIGKGPDVDRLIGSLQVDISHTCETLGWRPPMSVDTALCETAKHFLNRIV